MDLQAAKRLSGLEGRIARLLALLFFAAACAVLAGNVLERTGIRSGAPAPAGIATR